MSTFAKYVENYAALAVEIGVNIQPGQYLYIAASTDTLEFTRAVTKKPMKLVLNKYLLT